MLEFGDFLNKEQKEAKQKIMEELFACFEENISSNRHLFDEQTLSDLILSIMMMFTRDTLLRFIATSNLPLNQTEDFLASYFASISIQLLSILGVPNVRESHQTH